MPHYSSHTTRYLIGVARSTPTAGSWRSLGIIWGIPLLVLYVVGGIAQYFDVITATQCNVLVLLFFFFLTKRRSFWRLARLEIPIVALVAYFIAMGTIYKTPVTQTAVYLYYSACMLLAAPAGRLLGRQVIERHRVRPFLRVVIWGIALELVVTALQRSYASALAAGAAADINSQDAVFGTLYMKSDAVLAGCSLLAVFVYAYISKRSSRLLMVSAMAACVIFLGGSKAMQGASLILLPAALAVHAYQHTSARRYKQIIIATGILGALAAVPVVWSIVHEAVFQFAGTAAVEYARRDDFSTAGRFAPFGQLLHEGVMPLLFGHGALTYYNPISKEWLYNSGFSTFNALSIDFGLVSIATFVIYEIRKITNITPSASIRLLFIGVWISFVVFNDILSNVEFIFAFNFSLALIARHSQRKGSRSPGQDQRGGRGRSITRPRVGEVEAP